MVLGGQDMRRPRTLMKYVQTGAGELLLPNGRFVLGESVVLEGRRSFARSLTQGAEALVCL